jgi:outer membrane receptor for ferrienterochelin and colicins
MLSELNYQINVFQNNHTNFNFSKLFFISCFCLISFNSFSRNTPDDSLRTGKQFEEIIISATRNEQSAKNIPLPITVIDKNTILKMGAIRLNEVLAEQTGLQVIQDHGAGIQIQGLSTDYVLILIDGEPVVGRTKGNIDLTRFAVGNIERIEIVKGPSSSLYGSEAMGGIINIITKKGSKQLNGSLRTRYRQFNTLDLSVDAGKQNKKFGWYVFANQLRSDGYFAKGNTSTVTKTIAPFVGNTFSTKLSYKINSHSTLQLNARYFEENQKNSRLIVQQNNDMLIHEKSTQKDFSITPIYTWKINDHQKLQIKNHFTSFKTISDYTFDVNGSIYDYSFFNQYLNRTEIQYDHTLNDKHIITSGIGNVLEIVDATRYTNVNQFNQKYGFAQHQWNPTKKLHLISGFRYDNHNQYADRFSPKLAAGYQLSSKVTVQGSIGGGYKAPSFEQLLLNFTNPTAGYSVMGTKVAVEGIQKLQQQGQIQQIFIDPSTIGEILAERSIAYNLGFNIKPSSNSSIVINLFRNNIHDMIDFNTIAIKTNQGAIYSYFNRNKVITQGLEANTSIQLNQNFTLSMGYQYLDTRDEAVWEKIKASKIYYRDAQQIDRKVTKKEYGGLYNRSKHTGNIKINYEHKKYFINLALRGIFRSKFGNGSDVNGNSILDDEREYISGYQLWNLTARKQFKSIFIEAGLHNIFSVHTPYDPNTPPRNWYFGASWTFSK